jgi:hypothetical protein
MSYALIKALLSGIIIAAVSEISKRNPAFGALIISLPLLSIMAMLWLWQDTKDVERIAVHSQSTFWFVLPSLPMFLVLPVLLRSGVPFYMALVVCSILTATLYFVMVWALKQFGISF